MKCLSNKDLYNKLQQLDNINIKREKTNEITVMTKKKTRKNKETKKTQVQNNNENYERN